MELSENSSEIILPVIENVFNFKNVEKIEIPEDKAINRRVCRKKSSATYKPFRCPKCSRGFTMKGSMNRHYKYECGMPQRFECPYCQFLVRQKSRLFTHVKTRHPNLEIYCIDILTKTKFFPRADNIKNQSF